MENATFLIHFNIPNRFVRPIRSLNINSLIGECFPLSFQIKRVYMYIFYIGAEQRQELDTVINRMEAEREKLQAEVKKLKRDLAERDSETSSFEMRVNQRNVQLIDLQEQINDKTEEVSQLEKQVSTGALRVYS